MKLLRVKALADRVGVTPETVRHYHRIGLLKAQRDPYNGYKLFDEVQMERLRFITQLRRLDFSLKEIAEILEDIDRGRSPCPRVRELLARHMEETRRQQALLAERLQRMDRIARRWADIPDALPGPEALCPLVEAAEEAACAES